MTFGTRMLHYNLIIWRTEPKKHRTLVTITGSLKDNWSQQLAPQPVKQPHSSGCWRVLIIHMTLQTMWVTFILITVSRVWEYTLSSLFCQLSSRFIMSSMQWDKVERMPAVVALKVMASPLKSIPFIPLGLAGENTGTDRKKGNDPWLG